jgi:hypothetical protein
MIAPNERTKQLAIQMGTEKVANQLATAIPIVIPQAPKQQHNQPHRTGVLSRKQKKRERSIKRLRAKQLEQDIALQSQPKKRKRHKKAQPL